MNNLYFGISRPSWLLGVFMIAICIFLDKFGMARALLSNGNMRTIGGKAMIITCVV
jgi:hypothetical protein